MEIRIFYRISDIGIPYCRACSVSSNVFRLCINLISVLYYWVFQNFFPAITERKNVKASSKDESILSVTIDNERIQLTLKEFEILRLFLSRPGIAFTRDQLFSDIWGADYVGETRTVDMHIRTLRVKLRDYGKMIETVRGIGYRLEVQA